MSDYKTYEVRVYEDGRKECLFNGQLHREDGPAYEGANGSKAWFLNGEYYNEKDFHAEMARRKGTKTTCEGKIVEIDGKKYKLTSV
jgi:hypothetical protein